MLNETRGDLIKLALDGQFDTIVHGCNCFCTMGAGIAKTIKQKFPEAYKADLITVKADRDKLGTYSTAVSQGIRIINAYTQYDWRGKSIRADYDAIRQCMHQIARDYPNSKIGLPQIGAGLAGGDWNIILPIMQEAFKDVDATVVYYQP